MSSDLSSVCGVLYGLGLLGGRGGGPDPSVLRSCDAASCAQTRVHHLCNLSRQVGPSVRHTVYRSGRGFGCVPHLSLYFDRSEEQKKTGHVSSLPPTGPGVLVTGTGTGPAVPDGPGSFTVTVAELFSRGVLQLYTVVQIWFPGIDSAQPGRASTVFGLTSDIDDASARGVARACADSDWPRRWSPRPRHSPSIRQSRSCSYRTRRSCLSCGTRGGSSSRRPASSSTTLVWL